MLVYFVRHGESVSMRPGRHGATGNQGDRSPSSASSRREAVAERLGEAGATRVLTSPLREPERRRQAIAERLDLRCEVEELRELRESDGFGEAVAGGPEEATLVGLDVPSTETIGSPPRGRVFNEIIGRVRRLQVRLWPTRRIHDRGHHGIFLRFFLMEVGLGQDFQARQVRRLAAGSFNCGVCGFEHREPELESNYAIDPWRCFSWMAPAPTPTRTVTGAIGPAVP